MKKGTFLITSSLALLLGLGVVGGLSASKITKEVKAVNAGETVYLRLSADNWGSANADYYVYAFDGTADSKTFTAMTKVSTDDMYDVYKAVIPADNATIIFTRHNPGSTPAWDGNKWNQSGNLSLADSTSNLWVKTGGDNWGDGTWATGTYSETASNYSLTFYASSADYETSASPNAYVWGNCVTSPTDSYPGTPMAPTTKTVSYQGSALYKQTIEYKSHLSDHSDISINMIINNDGDYNKTETISVIVDGGYYYPTNNHWWNQGYTEDNTKGAAAAVAFELDKNICSLSSTAANSLRDDMETYETELSSATWNGYTYAQAYALVDSQCSTPKLPSSRFVSFITKIESNSSALIVIIVSVIAVTAVAGYFLLRRKKQK